MSVKTVIVPIQVFESSDDLGAAVAETLADLIAEAGAAGRPFVFGCPGGRTPRGVYLALAQLVADRNLELRHVWIAMMDDYVVPAADGFVRVPPHAHFSSERFAVQEIVGPLNAAAGVGCGVPADHVMLPSPADPAAYERRLDALGGVDFFLLASGAGDGHVAFNPPGSARSSLTRVVTLAEQTRVDNMGSFPQFASLDEVPRHGVTVGIDTIARLSKRACMLLIGDHKREAFARITEALEYDPSWPATAVVLCRSAAIYADRAAARPR